MRDAKPDVCVVIPTLNEYDTIGELIEELGELDEIRVRTIVVNDKSTDGTKARKHPTEWSFTLPTACMNE